MRPIAGGAAETVKVSPTTAALHGALAPNTTVVYVLDCSGSMGAAGKIDRARAALGATLRLQGDGTRFQVIVYAGTAKPLLATGAVAAGAGNVRMAIEKLEPLEARGKSNHLDAIRCALGFHPDVIVVLTDADDLTRAALKPLLATMPRPVLVCVGRVTTETVQRPQELK